MIGSIYCFLNKIDEIVVYKLTMKKHAIVLLLPLLFFSTIHAHAQSDGGYSYSSEFIWGITKATNSGLIGGLNVKFTRAIGERQFHGFGLEIVNVKDPQEQNVISNSTGNSFILGKQNYLYSIRMMYDREFLLFKKAPQQGVQVNLIFAGGPTLGLEAPYYVEILQGNITRKVPYTPDLNDAIILGTGNIFQGIGESSVVPGLNAKTAVAFEFGAFKSNVVGLEVGFLAELFTRDIVLVPTTDNTNFFPSAFITLFYGSRK